MEVRNDNFYSVQGWMLNDLHLQGTELQVYAIIYGFTQDGDTWFNGSVSYLEQWTGASKRTVLRALDSLSEAGLLQKDDNFIGTNYKRPRYKAVRLAEKVTDKSGEKTVSKCHRCQNDTGAKMSPTGVKMSPTGVKMSPNRCQNDTDNNIYNINNNNIYINNDRSLEEEEERTNEPNLSTLSTTNDSDMIKRIWNKRFAPFGDNDKFDSFVQKEGTERVVQGITRASQSRYLTGQTNGKPMTINWFLSSGHLQDILDGKYDDRLKVVI